jgi:hypothetical protein
LLREGEEGTSRRRVFLRSRKKGWRSLLSGKGEWSGDAKGGATASVATEPYGAIYPTQRPNPNDETEKGGRRRTEGRAATRGGGDGTTMKRHKVEAMQAGEGTLARRKKERAAGEKVRCSLLPPVGLLQLE